MEPPRNRCLTDASTIELPDGSILECGARRPPQTFSVLPRMGQSSTDPFAQNLALELGEHSQQSGHGSPEGRSQVQRLGQRYEPDAEMLKFLQRRQQVRHRSAPAVQAPHQYHVDLPTARGVQQFFPHLTLGSTRADLLYLQSNCPAAPGGIFPQGAVLQGKSLLVLCGHASI